jgi:hypothetical protein
MRPLNNSITQKKSSIFYAAPVSTSRQLSLSSTHLSDHKPFMINLCPKKAVIVWNIMMHCKHNQGRYNNGFRMEESKADYQKRLVLIGEQFCSWIETDPSIIAGMFAEGPIEREDISILKSSIANRHMSGWGKFHLTKTDFGVTKILKNGFANRVLYEDTDLTKILEPALRSRVQSFKSNESYRLTNIHVPFQDPQRAYKKILTPIVENMVLGIREDQYRFHDICGDKNIPSSIELETIREVFEETTDRLQQKNHRLFSPVSMRVELQTSQDGHLKHVNGEQNYYQVDSAARIIVTPIGN